MERFTAERMMLLQGGYAAVGIFFFFGLFQISSAQDISCNVTQEGGHTRYSVPEFKATGCYYQWADSSFFVLANHGDEPDERVVKRSDCTLHTDECFSEIRYSRDCLSEGGKREATCSTNCSRNAQPSTERGFQHLHWIVPVGVLLLLGVVLVVLGLLCFRSSCVKDRCIYTSVNTQNNTPV